MVHAQDALPAAPAVMGSRWFGTKTYFTRVQSIVKELHLDAEPRRDDVIQELLKMGVNACSTHFDPHSIKMAENRTFLVDAVKNVRSRSIQKKALSHSIGTR